MYDVPWLGDANVNVASIVIPPLTSSGESHGGSPKTRASARGIGSSMSRARDAREQNIIKRRRHECRRLSQLLESPYSAMFSGAKDGAFLSSLRDWCRGLPVNPLLETVGYDRSSLRDFSGGDILERSRMWRNPGITRMGWDGDGAKCWE